MCDCHEILALLKGSSLLAGNKKACLQVLGDAIPSYVSFFSPKFLALGIKQN